MAKLQTIAWRTAWVLGFAFIAAAVLLPMFARVNGGPRPSCARNLKQLSLIMKVYANESPSGLLPPLSSEPGQLMWTHSATVEYVSDPRIYICPSDNDSSVSVQKDDKSPFGYRVSPDYSLEQILSESSYVYFGYALLDDDDVEAFASNYRASIAAGRPLYGDIPLAERKTSSALEIEETQRDPNRSPGIAAPIVYDTLFRLSERVDERFFEDDPEGIERTATDSAYLMSRIPILMDRLGNHIPDGGNVVYLDGHVEFIRYPGKWPMTEKTIGLLLELDALGAN